MFLKKLPPGSFPLILASTSLIVVGVMIIITPTTFSMSGGSNIFGRATETTVFSGVQAQAFGVVFILLGLLIGYLAYRYSRSFPDSISDDSLVVDLTPYGRVNLDLRADSKSEMESLIEKTNNILMNWNANWSLIKGKIDETIEDCGLDLEWETGSIVASVYPTGLESFMGDRSDTVMSIVVDHSSPEWDAFFKDGYLVHFQPVF